ncbi:hypothetical protein OH77DRAFT_743603 [Trametes cingulata]|nr:hypothetical protein OH77DRAFT_743603 [Trametes cingulata]
MPALEDYLTKQIFIEKNVVTYRSLSRQLGLHVNAAKTALAKFHEQSTDSTTRSFATYLISGELFPTARTRQNGPSTQGDDGMEVDSEGTNSQSEEEEEVQTTTLTLVGEKDLEHAKTKYARIFSVHVYCLSPSPLTDAGLICDPSAIVYKADAKEWPTSSIALGRVVGPDVKIGKVPPPMASSSKAPAEPISRKPTLKVKTEPSEKSEESPPAKTASTSISSTEKEKEKEKSTSLKAKPSGKLDWSKAKKTPPASEKGEKGEKGKAKEEKQKEKAAVKKEESTSPVEKAAKKTAKLGLKDDSPKDDGKRGVKRKVAPPAASDTEDKPKSSSKEKEKATTTPKSAKPDVKLRKNRVVSESEDEDASPAPPRKSAGKNKSRASAIADALESDAEQSLRAMMDIDDSLVEKASASRPPPPTRAPSPAAAADDEDVEMAEDPEAEPEQETQEQDDAPKPKPRKKKEKKVVPVGRNGLKKKRVMKSRMTVDAKGYMVTEDYSSYESVDEEEAEEEPPKKGKGKKTAATSSNTAKSKKPTTPDADASDEEPAAKPKPVARTSSTTKSKKTSATKGNAQGSLKDFFGKPKK